MIKQIRQKISKFFAAVSAYLAPFPPRRSKDWIVSFIIDGKAGETKRLIRCPQVHFRGEKLVATDSSGVGADTRIISAYVGTQPQMLPGGLIGEVLNNSDVGTPTSHFGPMVLGNGLKWDVCEKALSMEFAIYFHKDSRWEGTVFGQAML